MTYNRFKQDPIQGNYMPEEPVIEPIGISRAEWLCIAGIAATVLYVGARFFPVALIVVIVGLVVSTGCALFIAKCIGAMNEPTPDEREQEWRALRDIEDVLAAANKQVNTRPRVQAGFLTGGNHESSSRNEAS